MSKIIKSDPNLNKDLKYAGKRLGFWDGYQMVFESEEETDTLMNYIVFEKNKQGRRLIDAFYESDIDISSVEKEILEGAVNSIFSLFEITDLDPYHYEITLKDVLENDHQLYTLMDTGLSQTARKGFLLFTRLMPVRDIYITSGVSFPFESSQKERIFNDISMEKFKKKKKRLNSSDLYILFSKKSKTYGINYFKKDV